MSRQIITTLADLRKGDLFTIKSIEYPTDMQVFVRGDYDRSTKKYSCYKYGDINSERFFAGSKIVYTDFTF